MITISSTLMVLMHALRWNRILRLVFGITAWTIGSCLLAELFGYWLHRFLHSGVIRFLSRNHMKHHLVFYAPLQKQRSQAYCDATEDSVSLGNIGLEWLVPAGLVIALVLTLFHFLRVPLGYQLLSLGITVAWSFLMFSYLHDMMRVEGFCLAKHPLLKRWFLSARRLHDIHHRTLNDSGLMDKNFGIAFFAYDRLFGTLKLQQPPFNHRGYALARKRFKYVDEPRCGQGILTIFDTLQSPKREGNISELGSYGRGA